jgi:hypothetical protein
VSQSRFLVQGNIPSLGILGLESFDGNFSSVPQNSNSSLMANQTKSSNPEWDRFTAAMKHIVSVPHSEVKAHLDREKEAKKLKRTRKSRYNAFREVNRNV